MFYSKWFLEKIGHQGTGEHGRVLVHLLTLFFPPLCLFTSSPSLVHHCARSPPHPPPVHHCARSPPHPPLLPTTVLVHLLTLLLPTTVLVHLLTLLLSTTVSGLNNLLAAYEDKSGYALCTFGFCEGKGREVLLFRGKTPVRFSL